MEGGIGATGVLHTHYTKYGIKGVGSLPVVSKESRLENALNYLKARENAFYSKFGVNNFEQFKQLLDKRLNNQSIQNCLAKFQSHNLNNALQSFANKGFLFSIQEEYVFEIKGHAEEEMNAKLKKIEDIAKVYNQDITIVKTKGSTTRISLKFNDQVVRQILNSFQKKNGKHRNFPIKSSYKGRTEALGKALNQASAENLLVLSDSGQTAKMKKYLTETQLENFPFGFSATEVNEIIQGSDISRQELLDYANKVIEDFLLDMAAGTPELFQQAVRNTYNKMKLTDFSYGKNFLNGIKGVLGEFQMTVIINYVYSFIHNATIAEVVANEIYETKKGKMDVSFFNGMFGLQSKNYNKFIKDRKGDTKSNAGRINLTTSLAQFAASVGLGEHFISFVANYFFNSQANSSGRGDMERINKFVAESLYALYNLQINNNIENAVGFYGTSAENFVPGSMLLEAAIKEQETSKKADAKITGPNPVWDDANYITHKKDSPSESFTTYWRKTMVEGWYTTARQKSLYADLVNHTILIKSSIKLTSISNISNVSYLK